MTLVALLLVVEGLSSGLWIARLVPRLSLYSTLVIGLVVIRGLVGATQLAGGVFLMGRRPAAVTLSQWALIASATLTTFEIGARMAPNNLVPGLRWPLVVAYWVYALGAGMYLRGLGGGPRPQTRVQVDKDREVQVERTGKSGGGEQGSTGREEL